MTVDSGYNNDNPEVENDVFSFYLTLCTICFGKCAKGKNRTFGKCLNPHFELNHGFNLCLILYGKNMS